MGHDLELAPILVVHGGEELEEVHREVLVVAEHLHHLAVPLGSDRHLGVSVPVHRLGDVVTELGPDGVQITYSSSRRLCHLLRGLTEGTAGSFGERATITETECMLRGGEACRLDVRLEPA